MKLSSHHFFSTQGLKETRSNQIHTDTLTFKKIIYNKQIYLILSRTLKVKSSFVKEKDAALLSLYSYNENKASS